MKPVAIFCTILFALFAALQFNDPDPWLWSSVYFATATLWLARTMEHSRWEFEFAFLIMLVFWMGSLVTSIQDLAIAGVYSDLLGTMSPDKPYIEGSREFLGLAIAAVSVGWLLASSIRAIRTRS
jgi:hypothetical protein